MRLLSQWRWTCLLLALVAAMFLSAAANDSRLSDVVTMSVYALVFAGTLREATLDCLLRRIGLCLVALWFGLGLLGPLNEGFFVSSLFIAVTVCILLGCLLVTMSELARNRDAGLDPIMGAVFGYILIGASWSLLYAQIEINNPGAFNTPSERMTASEFIYFSLVTMTSLGYGDITPATPIPRLLAGLQAATGTIYIAVFIGRVVGRFKD